MLSLSIILVSSMGFKYNLVLYVLVFQELRLILNACPAGTGGVFSADRGGENLDRHVAGLFGLMKPGTVMITLNELRSNIGFSRKTATARREKLKLPNATDANASFFEYKTVSCC